MSDDDMNGDANTETGIVGTTLGGITGVLSRAMHNGHAVTISFGGRALLVNPLSFSHHDGKRILTYWNAERARPERHAISTIREVVDLGRPLSAIRPHEYGNVDADRPGPGRPRLHDEPRRDIYLRLPVSLVDALDNAAGSGNRTAYIERLLRERLMPGVAEDGAPADPTSM